MKNKRIVIVQCRLSSTRLPGKALMKLGGKPVLAWVLSSMKKVPADYYYVATDKLSYPELNEVCKEYGFKCFAGDLNNVLKRFCDLLSTVDAETVVRATADNPFLFYEAAIESTEAFEQFNKDSKKCDYFTYSGLPHGSGVEIFSASSLLAAAENNTDPYDTEHVGPALYNHKDRFNCIFEKAPAAYNFPELRTTIDTYSDYLRACKVVAVLSNDQIIYEPFTTKQILDAITSNEVKNPVVYVPSVTRGHGTGHLHRCLKTALESKSFVYIPEDKTLLEADMLLEQYKEKGLCQWQIIPALPDETYPCVIVTDKMVLSKKESETFSNHKSFIAIDEGSGYTQACDYLLDIIPSYKINRDSNIFDSSYIVKPENIRKNRGGEISNILICVGGEDPGNLVLPALMNIIKIFPEAKITAVLSENKCNSAAKQIGNNHNIILTQSINNLREKLFEYDLVITHYGLTAFEAVYAGCAVVMLATTKLHEKLADKYNFSYIPEGKITEEKIRAALSSKKLYPELPVSIEKNSLSECINNLAKGSRLLCPVCQKNNTSKDIIVSRNITRTYRRCSTCGMVYMAFSTEADKKYEKAYFFEDYKKQYGKTYQEDFEAIKKQCLKRIDVIKTLHLKNSENNVLDIGCAYGPFLSAASDMGFNAYGTDISEDAVNYVKSSLHYPASCSPFPAINIEEEFGVSEFDVCTMWYVIEHFKDLDAVLTKVNQIVKKNGIFAFSTPSGEGVSAKSDKNNFYKISPTDHYSIWEPSKANKILSKYGFEVIKIVSTGHHPERFPAIKKSGAKKGSIKWYLTDKWSHLTNLGDTVEIYCRKVK